jgi:hypothetical protein
MLNRQVAINLSQSLSTSLVPRRLVRVSDDCISVNLTWLKLLAMAAMVFDHVAFLILRNGGLGQGGLMDLVWRMPGRISIPVFAFLVAWGYEWYTKDRVRYALRLWVFALLSEPVYFAFFGHFGNAILPLALGATVLLSVDSVQSRLSFGWVVMAGLMVEFYALLDNSLAVMMTAVLVFCFHRLIKGGRLAAWWLVPSVGCMVLMNEAKTAYLVMIPVTLVLMWSSVRVDVGLPKVRMGKWLGYSFYPGHLAVLLGVSAWLLV